MDFKPGTPIEVRFWARVEKRGPDQCWLWKEEIVSEKKDLRPEQHGTAYAYAGFEGGDGRG